MTQAQRLSGVLGAGLFATLAIALVAQLAAPAVAQQPEHGPAPAGLSSEDWRQIRTLHRERLEGFHETGGGHSSRHLGQSWTATFDGRGFELTPDAGAWCWGLELRHVEGLDAAITGACAQALRRSPTQLSYRWSESLSEWFERRDDGLEHGFTVHHAPAAPTAENPGQIVLELAVRGALRPRIAPDGRDATFEDAEGRSILRYGGLLAFDADRVELPATFEEAVDGLRIRVRADGARYPITIDPLVQQAYLKASNTGGLDQFGTSVDVSGETVVVGARGEDSSATGVNGNEADNSTLQAGAAYVYTRTSGVWAFQAYLKASNTGTDDVFGGTVAVSGDTIVVGAQFEDSASAGVDGNGNDNSLTSAGAAYVFARNGSTWTQQAYLKPTNPGLEYGFGCAVDVSGDTIVVGEYQDDNFGLSSGAAHVFVRNGTTWSQQAYLKASNVENGDWFGYACAISGDTIAIGAPVESSDATGVNGDQSNNDGFASGAVYVFERNGAVWSQQAYLKASTNGVADFLGFSVAISGNTIVAGAIFEASASPGVNGDQLDNSLAEAGAAYVFERTGSTWAQQAYLKAVNHGGGDRFGNIVAVAGDFVAVGAPYEDGSAVGVGGTPDDAMSDAGAVYVFQRSGSSWSAGPYVKASNPGPSDQFGFGLAWSAGRLLAGAPNEDSNATGVDGDQLNNLAAASGAAYALDWDAGVTSYCAQTKPTSVAGCTALLSVTDTSLATGEWESTNIPRSAGTSAGFSLGIYVFTHGPGIGPSGVSTVVPYGTLCLQSFKRSSPLCAPALLFTKPGACSPGIMRLSFACSAGALGISVGDDVNAQLWYRDPTPANSGNANFSNAVFYTVQ